MKYRALMLVKVLFLISIATVGAAMAEDTEISRWTIDNGGVTNSTGGSFELSGTIGQSDAGLMIGRDFELTGGFWFGLASGDCDNTGCIDLLDYDALEACFTGPGTGVMVGCDCFDMNHTDTVDLLDFAVGQTTFTGS